MPTLPHYSNRDLNDLLKRLAPGVFLATSAYSNEADFRKISYPNVVQTKLLSIKTPQQYNDTQVHVALVEEWDRTYDSPSPQPATEIDDAPQSLLHSMGSFKNRFTSDGPSAPAVKGLAEEKRYNIVFSFRGTEPWQACDWLADINAETVPISWLEPDSYNEPEPKAHKGFLYGLDSVTEVAERPSGAPTKEFDRSTTVRQMNNKTLDGGILTVLDQFKKKAGRSLEIKDLTRIVVVGHSLGGALATLASAWTRQQLPKYLPDTARLPVTCISTGCPRVGNLTFMRAYTGLLDDPNKRFTSYRIVHNRDVVPSVPFADWGFYHVGQSIWLCKVLENWARVYRVMTEQDISARLDGSGPLVQENDARASGYTLSVMDHFQWRYNSAISAAVSNTISHSVDDYLERRKPFDQAVGTGLLMMLVRFMILLAFTPANAAIKVGQWIADRLQIQILQNPNVASLYRIGLNLLMAFFTVPVWILTHIAYHLDG